MNLEQLEAIAAVHEQGSFRAAAQILNRSQPALSTTIKNLEEEFGIQIFDRSDYRPKLTEVGAIFLGVAKSTLEAAHHTSRVAAELGKKKTETKLVVSLDPLISNQMIQILVRECQTPLVPVNLILDKTILKGSLQPLIEGKIDLAFAIDPKEDDKLEKVPLEKVTLIGAISKGLLQDKKKAGEKALKQIPQILVYDRNPDEPSDTLLPSPLLKGAGQKIFVPDHSTKLRLIEQGIGWGRISKTELEDRALHLTLIERSLCSHHTFDLCLLRSKRRPLGPVARQIWKVFEDHNF